MTWCQCYQPPTCTLWSGILEPDHLWWGGGRVKQTCGLQCRSTRSWWASSMTCTPAHSQSRPWGRNLSVPQTLKMMQLCPKSDFASCLEWAVFSSFTSTLLAWRYFHHLVIFTQQTWSGSVSSGPVTKIWCACCHKCLADCEFCMSSNI